MSNPAIKALEEWAAVGEVLNMGRASVFVNCRAELVLAVQVERRQGERLTPWLKSKGRRFQVEIGRNPTLIRVCFKGAEAVKVLNQTKDRLRDPALVDRADLAERYWRTIQKPGIRLGVEHREERLAVLLDFETLKQFPEI